MFTLLFKLIFKLLWKLIFPILLFGVVAFIAWINIKYWNSSSIDIPGWARHIMVH